MFPLFLALLSAFLFGVSTPLSKGLLGHFEPQVLAGLLYLGAALGAGGYVLARRESLVPGRLDRKNRLRLSGAILFGGILAPVLLLLGLNLAKASSVSLWLNLEMVATSLLGAIAFRDHLGRAGWTGAACVLVAGLLLSFGEGIAGLRAGALLGFACLCWGLDNNLTALIDGLTPMQSTFWKGLVAGFVNLTLGISLSGLPQGPVPMYAGALGVGAVAYGASIILYITAAQQLGATRSQLAFAAAPFFGLAASALWLREPITPYQAAAATLQIAGLALLFRDRHHHEHTHEAMEHTHAHTHDDAHHLHAHPGMEPGKRHTHAHAHPPMRHSHPHWPDLHHRHAHGQGGLTHQV
jgi:drug/metabolite transporter (DMT)-like permease